MWGPGALWLLLSLSLVGASKYLYSEIIVPKVLGQQAGRDSKREVSYIIRIEGINRIVHLHRNSFIFRNMPVYSYNEIGDRQEDHPHVKVDCYYSGFVEDVADSDVVLSTCIGLWGYIQIGNLKYEIQPVENSPTFQHLIYQKEPEQQEPCREVPGEQGEWASSETQLREAWSAPKFPGVDLIDFPGIKAPSRYLGYFVVCGNTMLKRERNNSTRVILVILQIFSVLHNVYSDIGLHITLTGIELWKGQDYLTFSDTPDNILDTFYNYASNRLQHQTLFDHAALFMVTDESKSFGKQWQEHTCLPKSVSVSVVKIFSSPMQSGVSAAHQLGHAIGFAHDDFLGPEGRKCDCECSSKPGHCIMYPTAVECHRLSNCSKNAFHALLAQQGRKCFLNLPEDEVWGNEAWEDEVVVRMCGNGVLEGDEECDCGTDEACRDNGCCLKDCRRNQNATCFYGKCCENCKLVNEGTLCREANTECDLPEYCTGSAGDCPADVYKQDGMPCGNGDNCYLGKCFNLHQQCRTLFGPDAKPAPMSCYKEINMKGDRMGNCGKDDLGYKKCKEEDIYCGRIQCVNVKKIPIISSKQGVIQTPIDDILCLGTEFHEKEDVYDIGAIKDGASCGEQKICLNRACVGLSNLKYDCDFSKCNNQGVCNNKRNCHCAYGWAPPFCSSRGFGGSIDSGPPPEVVKSKKVLLLGPLIGVALLLLIVGITIKKNLRVWKKFRIRQKLSEEPTDSSADMDSASDSAMDSAMDSVMDSAPENEGPIDS